MPWLEQILLPVDFSDRSLGAARYAAAVARHCGSSITLLHVLQPPHYEFAALEVGGPMLSELFANRSLQVQQQLDSFLAEELAGLRVERVLTEGDPARRIVEYAHDKRIDMIFVPTHGYGPFRRFILGSVTAKVLHDADCPVWTGVHLEQAPPVPSIPFREVLCAIDLGPQSCKVLHWAARAAAELKARLTVVHAAPCLKIQEQGAGDALRQSLHEQAMQEIERLGAELPADRQILVESGDPPAVVRRVAEKLHAGVLVIGRGSAAGVFGRLRTNAYAIIRESPCPVVSV
ncbi:MAG: universal stress protein [Bryobacterales bacterium]|nr:universal stress protein [Bryobacterales bacterium]